MFRDFYLWWGLVVSDSSYFVYYLLTYNISIRQLNVICLYCRLLCGWIFACGSEDLRWKVSVSSLLTGCVRKDIWLYKLFSKIRLSSGNCLNDVDLCKIYWPVWHDKHLAERCDKLNVFSWNSTGLYRNDCLTM